MRQIGAVAARGGMALSSGQLQQSIGFNIAVAKVQQPYDSFKFDGYIMVQPQGLASRVANSGECEFRIQYPWGLSSWTDFQVALTGASYGLASMTVNAPDMRFPSDYRATARHIASGAEVGIVFHIADDGTITSSSGWSQTVLNAGSTMPATFQQETVGAYNQVKRDLAIPEVRNFPFTSGYAVMHSERRAGGLAIHEVRQWPSSGPNPALPGVLIRVRQGDAPGTRNVAV